MTWIMKNTSKRLSARLVGGLAVAALLGLSALAPAHAEWRGGDNHGQNWGGGWGGGGYYNAPPVVYGSSYGNGYYGAPGYYAPPVVYGGGVGVSLPGVNIGIR
jgi:hypothetical protein